MSDISSAIDRRDRRDDGSVLPMVLAMLVIGSLIVIPMLHYAGTVLRANSVVVQRTENIEDIRAGARVALMSPQALFNLCDGGSVTVPEPVEMSTTTTCRQVSEVGVIDKLEIPYGAVAIQLNESIPAGASGSATSAPASAPTNWWDAADEPDPKQDTIWMPRLPEVASDVQEASGYPMPGAYNCRVYFPGTYTSPIVLKDRAYFTSGVYYFKNTVTVVGGADVVVGYGLAEGCTGDLEAVLDMPPNPLPTRLNVEGLGATFVFGEQGRLIVDDTRTADNLGNLVPNNTNMPIRLEFNQRYVESAPTGGIADGGARVAIMSVNGDWDIDPDPATTTPGPLDILGVIAMPVQTVQVPWAPAKPPAAPGTPPPFPLATSRGYMPSVFTAEPRAPEPPAGVTVTALLDPSAPVGSQGAASISWSAPVGNDEGGSTITKYVVRANTTAVCETDGATTCIVRGLATGADVSFTVEATNAIGPSAPSASVVVPIPATGSPALAAPAAPTAVTVADPALFVDAAELSWTAPVDTGNAPVAGYDVRTYRTYVDATGTTELSELVSGVGCSTASFRATPPATSCVVNGLTPVDLTPGIAPAGGTYLGYRFTVSATTAATNLGLPTTPLPPSAVVGISPESDVSSPPIAAFTGPTPWSSPPAPIWPTAPTYVPDPIVDIDLQGGGASRVTIAGYTAIPQGRIEIANPGNKPLRLVGGVMAGSFGVDAATLGQPNTAVGFANTVLQRTIELVTVGSGRIRSTLRIQVNANGADYAINSWVIQ